MAIKGVIDVTVQYNEQTEQLATTCGCVWKWTDSVCWAEIGL